MDGLKYIYYPGCTQETTAREYDESARAVCEALGIELQEMPEWTCCGASSGHSTDYWLAHSLSGRNLAIAEKLGKDTAVSCPACYLRLNATRHEFQNNAALQEKLPGLIDQPYTAKYTVRHILDIIYNSLGLKEIESKVVRPLTGLRVVAYYGCYLVRPPELTGFDDAENPQALDKILKATGAEVSDWRGKVECCGGSHSFTARDTVINLVSDIIDAAREVDAAAIVTACPLCQANLETRQSGKNPVPVFYFTELVGLALGMRAKKWFSRHIISPFGLLEKHALQ